MKISKYKCTRFAGIKDKEINFMPGLNVILGPNEAGKSTVVEGIYATIFKNVKLDKRKDKDFISNFMPYPQGDFIDGILTIEENGETYTIEKEWGNDPNIALKTSGGDIIKNEGKINEIISSLLVLGEGTYGSIVFAKQRDIKNTIENILKNSETTSTISSILRKTVMELDKVNLDKLSKNIEEEYLDLSKRWDIINGRPEGGRDISNPYKSGVGKVLASYYNKENKKNEMNNSNKAQEKYEEVSKLLKNKKAEVLGKQNELDNLSKIEGDIFKRGLLYFEILMLEEKLKDISRGNGEWPVCEYKLIKSLEDLKHLEENGDKLKEEEELSRKVMERDSIKIKLDKLKDKREEEENIKNKLKLIPQITIEDIKKLEELKGEIIGSNAKMNAGSMKGIIKSLDEVILTRDLEEKEKINGELEFKAGGFIKIEGKDEFSIQIKLGEIDVYKLREEYTKAKDEFDSLLEKLEINSLEEGRENKTKIDNIKAFLQKINSEISFIQGEEDLGEIEKRYIELDNIGNARRLEEIIQDEKETEKNINELRMDINILENSIKNYEERYESKDKLLEDLIFIKGEKISKEKEMGKLAPLPQMFKTIEEYNRYLNNLRTEVKNSNDEEKNLVADFYEAEKGLSETSYEELLEEYKEGEKEFNILNKKLTNIIKIREAFHKTKEDMDKDSFKPLLDSFSKYIKVLTNGRYKVDKLEDNLNFNLLNKEDKGMKIELLSTGTYDSLSLALRFSLLEYIFKDKNGFLILDDCLVDLDNERKEKAVELIRKYAEENQVIFTTCLPETGKLLGGNIINL